MLLAIALGGTEILVILFIALLVFGPSKLPQLGSSVGKMLRGFKSEMKALKEEGEESANDEIDVSPAPRD
jgi:sec-independent protein translocase protein TatA